MNALGAAITSTGLTVQRGPNTVLREIELSVHAGQITGLLGPSGCGKTTLMRTLVGVQAHLRGDARVLGSAAGSPALRRRVSYDTQAASVYDDLTVAQNLRYFARILEAPKGDPERVLRMVGLEAEANRRVESLSGGQRGRVSLAVALLGSPDIIVLDEPTVGLDPVLRSELWGLFRELAAQGAALLVSSHVMDEALRCDRLLLMREGEIIADTTPAELLETTGAPDAESAFLALIALRSSGHGRHSSEIGERRDP